MWKALRAVTERAPFELAPETALRFVDITSRRPAIDPMQISAVVASSRRFGWDGVVAEVGKSRRWSPDQLCMTEHTVYVSFGREPLPMEIKRPRGFARITMPEGSLWIAPAGAPFTHRNLMTSHWGGVEISRAKVRRVLGHDLDLGLEYAVRDEPLSAVLGSLLLETVSSGDSDPLFADVIAVSIISRLARLSGVRASVDGAEGALSGRRMKTVLDRIEGGLGERLMVADLAAVADLSTAHFAREFKRCTKESPHAFVVRRRLERARAMVVLGTPLATIATSCGFSDQAHLCRMFKREFGITPGTMQKKRSRFAQSGHSDVQDPSNEER